MLGSTTDALLLGTWDWLLTGLWRSLYLALPLVLCERLLSQHLTLPMRSLLLCGALAVMVVPPVGLLVSDPLPAAGFVSLSAATQDQTVSQWLPALVLVWLGVAALLMSQHIWQRWRLATWLGSRSQALPPSASRLVHKLANRGIRLRVIDCGDSAFVHGLWRPTIYLPAQHVLKRNAQSERWLSHALRHELTHLQRGDHWRQSLMVVLRCLLWPNPLVHYLATRCHRLRELRCDARVAQALGPRSADYLDTLLEMTAQRCQLAPPAALQAHAFSSEPGLLLQRLRALEDGSAQRRAHWLPQLTMVLVITVLIAHGQSLKQAQHERRHQQASAQLNLALADGPGIGSMHVKLAAQQLAAARAAQSPDQSTESSSQ